MIKRNHKRSLADVRAQVLTHIETHRRASVAEIHTLTGWAFRQNTIAFLRAMATGGLLVSCRAKIETPRAETYYFVTMAERDEWHAKGVELVSAKRRERDRQRGLRRTERRREQNAAKAAARRLEREAKALEAAMTREKLVKHVAKSAKKTGGQRTVDMGLRLDRDRERGMKRAEEKRRAEQMRAEPIITSATKITRAEPMPDRWNAEATMVRCFSGVPLGRLPFEPTSCAARAV